MGKADVASRLDSPTAPHPALKARILLGLDLLPVVPADTADVQEQVQPSTRKMPESSMADAQRGLDEIASRSEHLPGELGDLGPDPKPATHPPAREQGGAAGTGGCRRGGALAALSSGVASPSGCAPCVVGSRPP